MFENSSIEARCPGASTVVEVCSSIMAGPANVAPGPSSLRRKIGVSTRSWPKYACRRSIGFG
jgi:hypothetical protein